tara:strand:+ start:807 stop:1193 length:387 start_codon:yes stop_codon:yes gene_type:complete
MTPPPDFLGQALQFRVAMDQPTNCFSPSVLDLQKNLIVEEFKEFIEAYTEAMKYKHPRAKLHCLKELADLAYVIFQFSAAAGWELDEALDRVHKSNMSKLVDGKPVKNSEGKVQKGPNYLPPYLDDCI